MENRVAGRGMAWCGGRERNAGHTKRLQRQLRGAAAGLHCACVRERVQSIIESTGPLTQSRSSPKWMAPAESKRKTKGGRKEGAGILSDGRPFLPSFLSTHCRLESHLNCTTEREIIETSDLPICVIISCYMIKRFHLSLGPIAVAGRPP